MSWPVQSIHPGRPDSHSASLTTELRLWVGRIVGGKGGEGRWVGLGDWDGISVIPRSCAQASLLRLERGPSSMHLLLLLLLLLLLPRRKQKRGKKYSLEAILISSPPSLPPSLPLPLSRGKPRHTPQPTLTHSLAHSLRPANRTPER